MSKRKFWLGALLPLIVAAAWLAISAVGGPYFGRIDEVSSNDQSTLLPASAESTQAQAAEAKFRDQSAIPAIVVLERRGGLTAGDLAFARQAAREIGELKAVGQEQVSPAIPAPDREAVEIVASVSARAAIDEAVGEMGKILEDAPDGLTTKITGPAGAAADLKKAFGGIDGLLVGVSLIVVLAILLVVYRSPILPFVVLGTAMVALTASILVVWYLAQAGVVQLNGQVQGILFILVIGATTDYALLYVSRYKEALHQTTNRLAATWTAFKGSIEPIAAAAGTVSAGLLCLLFSDLNSNKALGPVGAIGIGLSLLAAVTFLPAVLAMLGRGAFWPRQPRLEERPMEAEGSGVWRRIAGFVDGQYRLIWMLSLLVLGVTAAGITQLRADGVEQNQLILGPSAARDGQAILSRHFPGGSGSPTTIVTKASTASEVSRQVSALEGVSSVAGSSRTNPSGTAPLPAAAAALTQVDGRVLVQVTLDSPADSTAAEGAVRAIRRVAHEIDGGALVGGPTAINLDTKTTSIRDRQVIIPIVLGVITIILMLLLRSVVAPLVLLATTVLSFATALGVSAVVFNDVLNLPGADPSVPLFGFVFLVALGIDYNIFLMTRVREESLKHGVRTGLRRGLSITGGVITSAGIVLAATFAALAVIPILFLLQLAFIVAFGVLLDTLVVRTLLVPALIRDLGPKAWWPSQLGRADRNEPSH